MNKFFDYLEQDMPDFVIRELLHYIRRFTQALAGEIPVEGKMDNYRFCASRRDDGSCRCTGCRWGGSASPWMPPCEVLTEAAVVRKIEGRIWQMPYLYSMG